MKNQIIVALAGNPNSGKTTIFNNLTGARQHVGNYPGVTVERKEGRCTHNGAELGIVDLPGTYSLTAYSTEELITRNFIINEKPDVVVSIIDASNLERNLYLAVQIMDLGVPMVMAFNMSDQAKSRGVEIDIQQLSTYFGVPIVQTVGHKGKGMNELLDTIGSVVLQHETAAVENTKYKKARKMEYGQEIENEIRKLESMIVKNESAINGYDARWLAVKLLENDREARKIVHSASIELQTDKSAARLEMLLGENPETALPGRRYGFISDACRESVRSSMGFRPTASDKIDSIVTNRLLGIPIFLGLMYLVFNLTFTLGEAPMVWLETLFGWMGTAAGGMWPQGSGSVLKSLVVDEIIGGVGGVTVFLPNILLLFLAIAILEDSGYMARAAFIMDRIMHGIGLHGKSFIPMLIGFGCSVPAIMATRTLENRRDRLATMLVIPLMSCGARLPIYMLIIPAFFMKSWHAPMLWIIYLTGILLAVVSAKILRSTLLKGDSVPFVMELPPYRMPALKGVVLHMWERGWLYLKKAGTIILGISILLWAVSRFPSLPEGMKNGFENQRTEAKALSGKSKRERIAEIDNAESVESLKHSIAGRVGHAIEPIIKPMGFDWKIGTALIGAIAAKEVFVAQMGIVYALGETNEESEALREKIRNAYSPLVGLCIMLFCLISAPCMATIAVTKRESNSWKWALFQLGGLTLMAYLVTVTVYQLGILIGIGG